MEVGTHVPPSSASGTGRPLSPHLHTPSSPAKSSTKKYEEAHRRASITTAAIMDAAASNLAIIQDESDAFEGMSEDTAKKLQEMFEDYSKLGAKEGKLSGLGQRSHTMDFFEFIACMKHLNIFGLAPLNNTPAYPLTGRSAAVADKSFLGELYRAVNRSAFQRDARKARMKGMAQERAAKHEKEAMHELGMEEFAVAMRTLSTHLRRSVGELLSLAPRQTQEEAEANAGGGAGGNIAGGSGAAAADKKSHSGKREAGSKPGILAGTLEAIKGFDEIKTEHMEALHAIFTERGGELDEADFIETFGVLMNFTPEEAATMFVKIDADNDGSVSWDEFGTYALALGQITRSWDADTILAEELEHKGHAHEMRENEHYGTISVAFGVPLNRWRTDPSMEKYVTLSNDGAVRLWYAQGKPCKMDVKHVGGGAGWALAACSMVMHNYCVVASNDQKMRLYAMEPRFHLALEYPTIKCQVLTVHCFAFKSKNSDQAGQTGQAAWIGYLAWGDDQGRVHLMREEDLVAERTRPGQGVVAVVDEKLLRKQGDGQRNFVISVAPGEWIAKIEFVPDLALTGMLVIACSDGVVHVFDIETRERVSKFQGHKLGVKAFAWCRQLRSIASAGLEREILMWDWKSGRRTGSLQGHKAPVIQMEYYDSRDILFSLDLRYWLFIWDSSKQILLDKINTDAGDPFITQHRFRAGQIILNHKRNYLVLCGRRAHVWTIKPAVEHSSKIVKHTNPLVTALYNKAFHQCITIDRIGLVCVWEIGTGKQSFRFFCEEVAQDGTQEEPTSATFDVLGRRLIIGWNLGSVVSYNFNNGRITCRYENDATMGIMSVQAYGEDGKGDNKLLACGLESCVLVWPAQPPEDSTSAMKATITPIVKCERRIQLPIWRKDWRVEFLSMDIHDKAGLIVTGRKDGHVLLWNTSTGFLRKEMYGGIFNKIDEDGSGTLSHKEVISYLMTNEHWSKQEAIEFCHRADTDGSGDIDKKEFMRELQSQRTISMIDPETGEAVYAKNDQNIEWVRFMKSQDNLVAAASSDGTVTFYDRTSGVDCMQVNLVLDKRDAHVTCVCFDHAEEVMIVGDSCGKIRCYDIKQNFSTSMLRVNSDDKAPPPQLSRVISAFKAHDYVVSMTWIERNKLILSSGQGERDVAALWNLDGEMLGSFGDSDFWIVPSKPDEGMMMRLLNAAETKHRNLGMGSSKKLFSSPPKKANMGESAGGEGSMKDVFEMPEHEQAAAKKHATLANFKAKARQIINTKYYGVIGMRENEVQGRLNRVGTFFERRMPGQMWDELKGMIMSYLETVWRAEVHSMSATQLKPQHNYVFRTRVSQAQKSLLSPEDSIKSIVDDFLDLYIAPTHDVFGRPRLDSFDRSSTAATADSQKSQHERDVPDLPPSEEVVSQLTAYVEAQIPKLPAIAEIDLTCLRAFLIVSIVHKKLEKGRVSVARSTASSEADSIETKNHRFEIQYGTHPSWPEGVTREERKRSMLVGTAVDYFTTKKNELNHGHGPEHWTEDPHLRSLASGTAFHIPLPGPHVPNIPLPPTRPKEPEAKGREKRRGKKGDPNKQGVGPISLRRERYRDGKGLTMADGRVGMGLQYHATPESGQGTWRTLFLYDVADTNKAMRLFGLDHLSHPDTKQHQLHQQHQQASLEAAKDSATPSLFIPSPQVSDSTRGSQHASLPATSSSSLAGPVARGSQHASLPATSSSSLAGPAASSRPARSSDAATTNEPDGMTAGAPPPPPPAAAALSHSQPAAGHVGGGPSGAAHGGLAGTSPQLPAARRGRQATPLSVRLASSLDAEAANATATEAGVGKEWQDTGKSQMMSSRNHTSSTQQAPGTGSSIAPSAHPHPHSPFAPISSVNSPATHASIRQQRRITGDDLSLPSLSKSESVRKVRSGGWETERGLGSRGDLGLHAHQAGGHTPGAGAGGGAGRTWVSKVPLPAFDGVSRLASDQSMDEDELKVPGELTVLKGKLYEAEGFRSIGSGAGEEDEGEWEEYDEVYDPLRGYVEAASGVEMTSTSRPNTGGGVIFSRVNSSGTERATMPRTPGGTQLAWKLKTFQLNGNLLMVMEEKVAGEEEGRVVCLITHSTHIKDLDSSSSDGPSGISEFAFILTWKAHGEEHSICVAGKDFRDALTWKRAIQKGIETAQRDRRIESMQAIAAEEKDRVRDKALERVSDAEELRRRRKGKVHTKVLANMARLVQVMGRGTHFMMEQRHASQTQLEAVEKEAAAKAQKTQLAAAAAGAAWLSDEDNEPDDEW